MPTAPVTSINTGGLKTIIRTANGQAIASAATATLNNLALPPAARTGHIMPTFTNNLLSLGKLCDAGCYAHFNKHALHVYNSTHNLILRGDREQAGARLWRVNLTQTANLQPHPLALPPQAALAQGTTYPQTSLQTTRPALIEDDHTETWQQPEATPQRHPQTPAQPPAPTTPSPVPVAPVATPFATPSPAVGPTPTNAMTTHKRAYDLPSTRALIEYLHATAGYPVKSTWLEAIKRGYYHSWPGLSYETAARYCPTADETIKGHMAQSRQHIRSTTQPTPRTLGLSNELTPNTATNTVDLLEIPLSKLFTDDTGRFPIRARSGNQYLMVAYHQQTNAILVRPFASKADTHRIPTYEAIMAKFTSRGQMVNLHILDNEASAAYKAAITANGCTYQLVPPHVHRRNAAERAIRTFKDHFLGILAGVDPSFPASRWDLLLPQAELTLNLLRGCHYDPSVSAWEGLNGYYKFDATPMGPLGSRVILHAKPELRKSWDFRGQDGFYVGPALNHYRCYSILKRDSQAVVISDTVRFRHHNLTVPNLTAEDKIVHALRALTHNMPSNPAASTEQQLRAIATLRDIFSNYATIAHTQPSPRVAPNVHPPTRVPLRQPPPRVQPTDEPHQ